MAAFSWQDTFMENLIRSETNEIYSLFSKHVIRWLVKFYSESAPDQLTESRLPHIILTEFLIMNDKGKLYKECLFTSNLTDTESY